MVSDGEGIFAADSLSPGTYQITASKGEMSSPMSTVEVAQSQVVRPRVVLAAGSAMGTTAIEQELAEMKERIAALESALLKARSVPEPAPAAPPAAPAVPPAPAPAPQPAPVIPEALQAPESTPGVDRFTPFAYADFTWLNGTSRNKTPVLDTKWFTPEVRFDTHFMTDFNQPIDHTWAGRRNRSAAANSKWSRSAWAAIFTGRMCAAGSCMGMFATTTPRNDASAGVGQWDLREPIVTSRKRTAATTSICTMG